MNGYNENGKPDGPWEEYWVNGKLRYEGNYINGSRCGLFLNYYSNGELNLKQYYL